MNPTVIHKCNIASLLTKREQKGKASKCTKTHTMPYYYYAHVSTHQFILGVPGLRVQSNQETHACLLDKAL